MFVMVMLPPEVFAITLPLMSRMRMLPPLVPPLTLPSTASTSRLPPELRMPTTPVNRETLTDPPDVLNRVSVFIGTWMVMRVWSFSNHPPNRRRIDPRDLILTVAPRGVSSNVTSKSRSRSLSEVMSTRAPDADSPVSTTSPMSLSSVKVPPGSSLSVRSCLKSAQADVAVRTTASEKLITAIMRFMSNSRHRAIQGAYRQIAKALDGSGVKHVHSCDESSLTLETHPAEAGHDAHSTHRKLSSNIRSESNRSIFVANAQRPSRDTLMWV